MTEEKVPEEAVRVGMFLIGVYEERLQIKRLLIECIPNMITVDHEAMRKEFGDAIATKLLPFYRTEGKRYEIDHVDQVIRLEMKPGYDGVPLSLYKELIEVAREKARRDGTLDRNLFLDDYGMFQIDE